MNSRYVVDDNKERAKALLIVLPSVSAQILQLAHVMPGLDHHQLAAKRMAKPDEGGDSVVPGAASRLVPGSEGSDWNGDDMQDRLDRKVEQYMNSYKVTRSKALDMLSQTPEFRRMREAEKRRAGIAY